MAKGPQGRESASTVVDIPEGAAKGGASLEMKSSKVNVTLVDADGVSVVGPVTGRFEPLLEPDGPGVLDVLEAHLHVDNAGAGGR